MIEKMTVERSVGHANTKLNTMQSTHIHVYIQTHTQTHTHTHTHKHRHIYTHNTHRHTHIHSHTHLIDSDMIKKDRRTISRPCQHKIKHYAHIYFNYIIQLF